MDIAYAVVTRGGSNTIFELVAMNKLHLIVPLGKEASRGDQLENAAYFEKKGYARQLSEDQLTFTHLQEELTQLFEQENSYHTQMKNSTEIKSQEEFYDLLKQDISKTAKGI